MTTGSNKENNSSSENPVQDRQKSTHNESISSHPDTLEKALKKISVLQAELDRKNLQLQSSQQNLATPPQYDTDFFDFAPIGYLSFDNNGNILNINRTAAEMLGDNHANFINQSFTPLLTNGQDKAFILHIRQAFSSGEKQSLELNIRNRQDKDIWVRLESTQVRQHIQTAIIDITDRKRAEQELEKSQRRYLSLFEDSPLPQWEEDFSQIKVYFDQLRVEGVRDFAQYFHNNPQAVRHCASLMRILDVNKAAVELFEAQNKHELIQDLKKSFTDASWSVFTEELITLAEGKSKFSSEVLVQTLTGKALTVSLQLVVSPGHEVSLSKVLLAMKNITAKRRAEEALQVANRELEARVKRRTAELARVNENLHKEIEERQIAELALASSEEKYRLVFSNESDAILLFDVENKQMLEVNDAAIELYGYTHDEFLKLNATDVSAEAELTTKVVNEMAGDNASRRVPLRWHKNKQGDIFPVEISAKAFLWNGREVMCAIVRDIRDRYASEQQLRQAARVFESANEAIVITDAEYRVVAANNAFTQITQFDAAEVIGRPIQLMNMQGENQKLKNTILSSLEKSGKWQGEFICHRKNGQEFPVWNNMSVVKDNDGRITNFVSLFSDISTIKESEEQLHFLAHHDPLTKLPNRLFFQSSLEKALERAKRHNQHVAILFLDLDRFKIINDTLGHVVGDSLLKIIGQRLIKCVRAEDTVARLGGDEFTVILDEINHAEDAAILAEKLLSSIAQPIELAGQNVLTGASIGISVYPDDASNSIDLIRAADTAMYRSKEKGKNTYEFYTSELTDRAFAHLSVEHGIREGLARGEFELYYQTQIELTTGKLSGVESLIRWNHPEKGIILPKDFIPLAEESNLINLVDSWAIDTAFTQAAAWRDSGFPPFKIGINISTRYISRTGIAAKIKRLLKKYELSPEWIKLEVTERVFQTGENCIRELNTLKKLGIHLSIDDFGTGYSNLASLKELPIDTLKIDQMFVKDILHDASNQGIVRAIIAMAHNLNLSVVAEGVETNEQLEFLHSEKCDKAQGFLFTKPLRADQLTALIQEDTETLDTTP